MTACEVEWAFLCFFCYNFLWHSLIWLPVCIPWPGFWGSLDNQGCTVLGLKDSWNILMQKTKLLPMSHYGWPCFSWFKAWPDEYATFEELEDEETLNCKIFITSLLPKLCCYCFPHSHLSLLFMVIGLTISQSNSWNSHCSLTPLQNLWFNV